MNENRVGLQDRFLSNLRDVDAVQMTCVGTSCRETNTDFVEDEGGLDLMLVCVLCIVAAIMALIGGLFCNKANKVADYNAAKQKSIKDTYKVVRHSRDPDEIG